jgi:serine/threonine-protein kinase HipA
MVTERESDELEVLIGGIPAGVLRRNRYDAVEFAMLESYKSMPSNPVLGQRFLDDPDRTWRVRSRVPEWFSNLLPEGALRELVAKQASVAPQREFILLRHLGRDLPGAVQILSPQVELDLASHEPLPPPKASAQGTSEWHFSLAGVQLKFSARENDRGLTIPVSGTGGNWIVKLPDRRYEGVPENERATMLWARESGIDVPQTRLVRVGDIDGLPAHMQHEPAQMAYAIRRFDRGPDGVRVHIEDFAQVLGLYPEAKYGKYNYETIANVIAALDGERGLNAFVRQLVFIVASGNGDAHLKNWSLIYPDGRTARLAPAYDLVSTIHYMPDDQLALSFARSKQWKDVSMEGFERLARKIGWPEREVVDMTEAALDAVLGAWSRSKTDFGYAADLVLRIEAHMRAIPLLQGAASSS